MKTKNICKIISESSLNELKTHSFIYETNISTMKIKHTLPHNRLILIKNGSVKIFINDFPIVAKAGTLLFAFKGDTFYAIADDGCDYMYIDFDGSRSDVLFKRFGINEYNRIYEGFDGLIPYWQDSLVRSFKDTMDLATECVLLHSLSRLNTIDTKQSNLILQIIDLTENNFNDPELSISSIANELNYNSKYLSHFFKTKMGVAYTEYLRTYRIKYAIMLMDHGIDSIKNIAALCGFSNPLYFSSVFKQEIGISPSDYKSKKTVKND